MTLQSHQDTQVADPCKPKPPPVLFSRAYIDPKHSALQAAQERRATMREQLTNSFMRNLIRRMVRSSDNQHSITTQ